MLSYSLYTLRSQLVALCCRFSNVSATPLLTLTALLAQLFLARAAAAATATAAAAAALRVCFRLPRLIVYINCFCSLLVIYYSYYYLSSV